MSHTLKTQTNDRVTLYSLTASGACSVTIATPETSITWQPLNAAGQTTFYAPHKAWVECSDASAILVKIPFKGAPVVGRQPLGGCYISYDAQGHIVSWSQGDQLQSRYQFYCESTNSLGNEISAFAHDAAFDTQVYATYQFSGVGGELRLPSATFANQQNGDYQFYQMSGSIDLPAATFASQQSGQNQFRAAKLTELSLPNATFADLNNAFGQFYQLFIPISLPKATFERQTNGSYQFTGAGSLSLPLASFSEETDATSQFREIQGGFNLPMATFEKVKNGYHAFSSSPCRFNEQLPMATFERLETGVGMFGGSPRPGLPRLNLRSLNNGIDLFPVGAALSKDLLLGIVYGPKLKQDAAGNLLCDAQGREIIDVEQGRHKKAADSPNRDTGWGIRDYRAVDEHGNFVLNSAGGYVYQSAGHTITFKITADLKEDTEVQEALLHLRARGWSYPE